MRDFLCCAFSRALLKVGQPLRFALAESWLLTHDETPVHVTLAGLGAAFFSRPLIDAELKVISVPASYHFDLFSAPNISSRFALDLLFPYYPLPVTLSDISFSAP